MKWDDDEGGAATEPRAGPASQRCARTEEEVLSTTRLSSHRPLVALGVRERRVRRGRASGSGTPLRSSVPSTAFFPPGLLFAPLSRKTERRRRRTKRVCIWGDVAETAATAQGASRRSGSRQTSTDPETGVAPRVTRGRNMRSRYRCSMCPAIHINSRSWLRSSSTHEPSDPPLRVVFQTRFFPVSQPSNQPTVNVLKRGDERKKRHRSRRGRPPAHGNA